MLKVCELSKHFGEKVAVDKISFEVNKGEVLGFLGPNGAGKSTTMKMITCFLEPTSGDVEVGGISILKDPISVKKQIGYMPENSPLYGEMTVIEFLEFMAELREIPSSQRQERIKKVVQTCHLTEVLNQFIETLSKGFKKRVSMAQALIHDPDVLILDEPTDGLDPNQKHGVRTLIRELAKEKCVVLSTHILEEVDAVCERAIIIAKGNKLYDGKAGDLKLKSSSGKIDDVFRAITTGETIEGVTL